MSKRLLLALCLAALTRPSLSTPIAEKFEGVQPDMVEQMEQARMDLRNGEPVMALAHADLVLIDHPLKVSVAYDGVGTFRQPECERAVNAALELWNRSLNGDERQFERAGIADVADIHLHFKPQVNDGDEPVGGLVKWRRNVVYIHNQPVGQTRAEVQIRALSPEGDYMSFEQMRHEVSHELGHVLGLKDSPRLGEIMSPLDLRHPVGKISVSELGALRRIRRAALELKNEALSASTE